MQIPECSYTELWPGLYLTVCNKSPALGLTKEFFFSGNKCSKGQQAKSRTLAPQQWQRPTSSHHPASPSLSALLLTSQDDCWLSGHRTHMPDKQDEKHMPACCCSVAQSCLTLGDRVDRSTPGLPDPHCLREFAQVHSHWVSNAIQPSHPLLPPLLLPFSPAKCPLLSRFPQVASHIPQLISQCSKKGPVPTPHIRHKGVWRGC